jgi:hypothetical protein
VTERPRDDPLSPHHGTPRQFAWLKQDSVPALRRHHSIAPTRLALSLRHTAPLQPAMAAAWLLPSLLAVAAAASAAASDGAEGKWDPLIRMPTEKGDAAAASTAAEEDEVGTKWAVLIAGSSGYGNYRHQVM